MIFSSFAYVACLAATLAIFALTPSNAIKKALLLIGSYAFYALWDWRFMLLMWGMTLANHLIAGRITAAEDQRRSRRWLALAVGVNLAVLGVFKYFNFFAESANALLQTLGVRAPMLEILLPVGISFITFELISYVVDLHRRTSPPARSFWDLALLVAFFPHLLAGPILKPAHFLPQLERAIRIRWADIEAGLQIFVLGLAKKVVVADNLAPYVDAVYAAPELYSADTLALATLAFFIQTYCDFSGYSDMAIGSARMLGFDIPRNFNLPYMARSITEFWRRWHISLSSWLRDYLYIPLGGSRKGRVRQHLNQLLTFALGGLWHGANWRFVVWGVLHGLALMAHQEYRQLAQRFPALDAPLLSPLYWAATFSFVVWGCVLFRAPDLETAAFIYMKMAGLIAPAGIVWHASALLWALPVVAAFHVLAERFGEYHPVRVFSFRGAFALSLALLAALFLAPTADSPFIYFQF